jgi:hypothetical protein
LFFKQNLRKLNPEIYEEIQQEKEGFQEAKQDFKKLEKVRQTLINNGCSDTRFINSPQYQKSKQRLETLCQKYGIEPYRLEPLD